MRTYSEALAYLNRYTNYELQRTARLVPEVLRLDRVRALLERLGNPHRAYPSVHIAGSKGKGSTAAMVASILRTAGYRTGLYTSPHLHTPRERIRVDEELITPAAFAALVDEMAPHLEAIEGITWFEATTALAFLHFARRAVDVAVIEVGLGGRLDATNVIIPLVSVITSLSYEHTAWLGDTLAQIAREKAGIVKPWVPVVCAPQDDEAMEVIEQVCAQREAPLVRVGRDWRFRSEAIHPEGQRFAVLPPAGSAWLSPAWHHFDLPLLGHHQMINATCALAAVDLLSAAGLAISPEAAVRGLAAVRWPGRMEVLSRQPLVVTDGAHNEESARRLVETLQTWFPGRQWTFVVGTSLDKDHAAILRVLSSLARRMIVTRARHERAADPALLARVARSLGMAVETAPNVEEALRQALRGDNAVCLTGSLFVAADARLAWARRQGLPLPEAI